MIKFFDKLLNDFLLKIEDLVVNDQRNLPFNLDGAGIAHVFANASLQVFLAR